MTWSLGRALGRRRWNDHVKVEEPMYSVNPDRSLREKWTFTRQRVICILCEQLCWSLRKLEKDKPLAHLHMHIRLSACRSVKVYLSSDPSTSAAHCAAKQCILHPDYCFPGHLRHMPVISRDDCLAECSSFNLVPCQEPALVRLDCPVEGML